MYLKIRSANILSSISIIIALLLTAALPKPTLAGCVPGPTMGDDVITCDGADDTVWAEDGNDIVSGGAGNDYINGEYGNDVLSGGVGNDVIAGDFGNDILNGDDGNDTVNGNDGDDNVLGNAGNDSLYGQSGNDALNGGEGDDVLSGGEGIDWLSGEAGNDILLYDTDSALGRDSIAGGPGMDSLEFSMTSTQIINLDLALLSTDQVVNPNLTLYLNDSIEIVYSGFLNDTLFGDLNNNYLFGMGGNDFLNGREAHDTLRGGDGDDNLLGGDGMDALDGEDGNDYLEGGSSDDYLQGGNGNDTLWSSAGVDLMHGGAGDDNFVVDVAVDSGTTLYGESGSNLYRFFNGATGHLQVHTTSDMDTLDFSMFQIGIAVDLSRSDEQEVGGGLFLTLLGNIRNVLGTIFDDLIIGNALENTIQSLDGDDQVDGAEGEDSLDGGDGYDRNLNDDGLGTAINFEAPSHVGDLGEGTLHGGEVNYLPVVTVDLDPETGIPTIGVTEVEAGRAIVFRFVEMFADGSEKLLAQVIVPAWSAPTGTALTFAGVVVAELPEMPDGMTALGEGFVLDADELDAFSAPFTIQFTIPSDVESGAELAVAHFNESTGEWELLTSWQSGVFMMSSATMPGMYALVQVIQP